MRAAVFHGPLDLRVETRIQPDIGPSDVLLQVDACGVCGSDLISFTTGHYVEPGQVMGHEIAATVREVGRYVSGLRQGTRVAVRPMRSCGSCGYCTTGQRHLCGASAARSLAYGHPGGYADLILVDRVEVGRDVIPVGDDVATGDLLWAEPLAVGVHAVSLAGPRLGALRVIGSGSVGLCVISAALAAGWTDVQVVEPRKARLQAAAALGARAVTPDAAAQLPAAAAAIDTSGHASVLATVATAIRAGGTLVSVGLGDDELPWPLGPIDIVGAFGYREADFAEAVWLIETGQVRLSGLETSYSLSQITQAFSAAQANPQVVKAVVRPALDANKERHA